MTAIDTGVYWQALTVFLPTFVLAGLLCMIIFRAVDKAKLRRSIDRFRARNHPEVGE